MKIKILGTGCAKCKRTREEAEKAATQADFPVEVEKVDDIQQILKYGVMMTPAVVLDEEVLSIGRVPASAEILAWIRAAAAKGG
jgi:small redox-active disulfide protein 2